MHRAVQSPIKRTLDLFIAACGILVLSPVFLLVSIAVALKMGRPVFFRQLRPGLKEQPFYMFKFRTMKDSVDKKGNPLPDEMRVTVVGNFLRRTSLDELPELLNVIKGDMSLVGPRPLLMSYLPLYSTEQAKRHDVKPGITGWAQVNGRNAISWSKKFHLDLWYIRNWTPALDLKIIWMTIRSVIKKEGISAEGHATMPPFSGNKCQVKKVNSFKSQQGDQKD